MLSVSPFYHKQAYEEKNLSSLGYVLEFVLACDKAMTMMILFGLSVLPATNFFITPRPQQEAHKSMQRIKLIYYGLIQRNKIVCLAQKDK